MTRQLYAGRYQAGDVIGSGVMSQVYRGRDQLLGRDVAIKVLRADLAKDPSFQARFRREAQNAASLNHPAIVAVYDTGGTAGVDGQIPFIVMEFVDGATLRSLLQAERTVPPRRALEIAADICAALAFSHRRGVVHRNVTPANVMVAKDGEVKVMDFAVARADDAGQTTATAVIGTAQYLSPEQAAGQTGDARSDIYATGCVLYEMLCGQAPFVGTSPVTVAYQHVSQPPRPPSRIVPGLPQQVDAIVLKALSKNPENRYQTALQMRDDLQRALAGQAVQATPLLSAHRSGAGSAPSPARRFAPVSGQSIPAGSSVDIRDREAVLPRQPAASSPIGPVGSAGVTGAAGSSWPAEPAARAASVRFDGTGTPVAPDAEPAAYGPPLLAPVRPVPAIPAARDREADEKTRHVWRLVTLGAVGVLVVVALWLTLTVVLAPPPPAKVSVPDLTGLTLPEAAATLQEKNLVLGTIVEIDAPGAQPGSVASQRPSELTQVDEGTTVNVEVDSS